MSNRVAIPQWANGLIDVARSSGVEIFEVTCRRSSETETTRGIDTMAFFRSDRESFDVQLGTDISVSTDEGRMTFIPGKRYFVAFVSEDDIDAFNPPVAP